ncbi:MAG: cupin domain-containing protein [Balneolales bacterium]|nr:cupin domain-containing protein [Balneolales bacterium]
MSNRIEELVQHLELKPHPEGGFYKETYRSDGVISKSELSEEFSGDRNYCTGIYFLLTDSTFSAFHKINQDEIWHFYEGDSLRVHMIDAKGNYTFKDIGLNLEQGESPQFTVPAGVWFASEVAKGGTYSLVGCTVSPGFDFDDFELPTQEKLISLFPEHSKIITRLTRL